MKLRLLALAVAFCLPLVACGGGDEGGAAGGAAEVAVAGTDAACTPAQTELTAGKTTFVFTNTAKSVSEIYVKNSEDKVVKELENVPTGQTRKLTVTLAAGKSYKITCKPGQKGDGFTTVVNVK